MNKPLPPGAGNGLAFAAFNVIPITLSLGTPMLLYFKQLGATATTLGLLAALPPLLSLLQLPASAHVERWGYRRFVLGGWCVRTVFLFGMAAVPLLPTALPASARILLMLALLFCFNASRGISMCGWLPWLSQWIPEDVRGRYLAREQMLNTLTGLAVFLLAMWWMDSDAGTAAYAGLFLVAAVGGSLSLLFLKRIPDVPVPPESHHRFAPPWRAMLRHKPFRKLLAYDLATLAAHAGSGVFWIPLLRDHHAVNDRFMLGMSALTSILAVCWLMMFGRWVDRVGSRPLLAIAGASHLAHYACWIALSATIIPLNLALVVLLQATSALSVSLYGLGKLRLLMAIVPAQGRSHFLALFTSATALASGFLPIAWGALLDSLHGWARTWGSWQWNGFTVVYSLCLSIMAFAQWLRTGLPEPGAMSVDQFIRQLLFRAPARMLRALKQITSDY